MKAFTKHLWLYFAVIFGNIFLSHGVVWLGYAALGLFYGAVKNPLPYADHLMILLMCVLPIAINILLYRTLLKKVLAPAERKKAALYFPLPVIPFLIWAAVFRVSALAGYPFGIETYIRLLVSFLPLVLITLIPLVIAYCLYFYKYVGEAYFVYVLSFFGVTVIPITLIKFAAH